MKRIGLFGGSFDPPHLGHLTLAIELKEKGELDEVWVVPAHQSPFRVQSGASAGHRLRMAKLAFEEIPGFKVWEGEIQRPPPSYTYETVQEILNRFPHNRYFLLLGEDAYKSFEMWKKVEEIQKGVEILVGARSLQVADKERAAVLPTRYIDISATWVRERLKKRLYCGHLLPPKVLDYIYENQLYFNDK